MSEILKEELFGTIKKKRFIILAALAVIGIIITAVDAKTGTWNDLTYFLAMQNYLCEIFIPAVGIILIISIYRKKYKDSSIMQAEEHGVKRPAAVLARSVSGALIILLCFLVYALFFILLGLILGANLSSSELGSFMLMLTIYCVASIAAFEIALFWLYVFNFPVFPLIFHVIIMVLIPWWFSTYGSYNSAGAMAAAFISPKMAGSYAFTGAIYSNPKIINAIEFILQIIVPLLLSMLVFKFKKIKPKKEKTNKKKAAPEETPSVADSEVTESVAEAAAETAPADETALLS